MARNKFNGSAAVLNPITITADDIRDERIDEELRDEYEQIKREALQHEAREEEYQSKE